MVGLGGVGCGGVVGWGGGVGRGAGAQPRENLYNFGHFYKKTDILDPPKL